MARRSPGAPEAVMLSGWSVCTSPGYNGGQRQRRQAMNLPEFLTLWAHREIMLTGHRIGLYSVIARYQEGMNVDQIGDTYPTLEPELIQKVLDFYHANQSEVDAYVAAVRAELEQQEAAAPPVDWDALRKRAEERKRAGGS